jgi:hypothetical protein
MKGRVGVLVAAALLGSAAPSGGFRAKTFVKTDTGLDGFLHWVTGENWQNEQDFHDHDDDNLPPPWKPTTPAPTPAGVPYWKKLFAWHNYRKGPWREVGVSWLIKAKVTSGLMCNAK